MLFGRRAAAALSLFVSLGRVQSQQSATFTSHSNSFMNPERGTYVMNEYSGSGLGSALSISEIKGWASQYYNTLVLFSFILDSYINTATLPAAVLNRISGEFATVRAAGIKAMVRFSYSSSGSQPYDASASIVKGHINQIAPILKANEDVLAVIQAGFVGAWGEWYYSDGFGNSCDGSSGCSAQNVADRKAVVDALVAATATRQVQVRTPAWIKAMYCPGGTDCFPASVMDSGIGRIGFHNDCYASASISSGEWGTYQDTSEYTLMQKWTKYTSFITETCAADAANACSTALPMSQALHMTSSHRLYNTDVWNAWISGGCYTTILNNMGYRFNLVSSNVDAQAAVGGAFNVKYSVTNVGFAAPINKRKMEVVLRNVATNNVCVADLTPNYDVRSWVPGTYNVAQTIRLPSNIPAGQWEVLLHFPDPFASLYGSPWYKIVMATNGVVEGTGLHKLKATVTVGGGSAGAAQAGEVTADCGSSPYALTKVVAATTPSASGSCNAGYYLSGSTCTLCPAGSSCSGTAAPKACGAGTWSAGAQSTCTACSSCSNGGTCQVNNGACLCPAGFGGIDCSLSLGSVPPPATSGPTQAPPATQAPTAAATTAKPATAAPTTAKPAGTTAKPATNAPTTAKPATAAPTTPKPATAAKTTLRPATAASSTRRRHHWGN